MANYCAERTIECTLCKPNITLLQFRHFHSSHKNVFFQTTRLKKTQDLRFECAVLGHYSHFLYLKSEWKRKSQGQSFIHFVGAERVHIMQ